jgi:hypothetical protein
MTDVLQLVALIEPVARILLGEPNQALSSKLELRYGSRGSLSIDLKKGTWYDHEVGKGGGTLDLVERQTGLHEGERFEWLEQHTSYKPEPKPNGGNGAAQPSARPKLGPIVETFDYTDEGADFLFQVTKHNPKDYRQRRHAVAGDKPEDIHDGCYVWGVKGVRHDVPYRLPELIEAVACGHLILIVEGEKDANNSYRIGIPATCNAGGAGKWRKELNAFLKGADVVIIPDNDLPGHAHTRKIAGQLQGIASRIRMLDLKLTDWPDMPLKADLSDWLERGGTAERLYELIEPLPDWMPGAPPPAAKLIKSSREFIADFVQPDYLIDGILQRRFLYSFTGKTGSGKTAVTLLIAASVALGVNIGDIEVASGRVLYFAGENADDIRMRWIAMAQHMNFDPSDIDVYFIDKRFKLSEMKQRIAEEIDHIGEFALIVIDTSAAYYEGVEVNSNTEQAAHAARFRELISMRGGPTVLVNCHPVKNASNDNLLPLGAGAFLNEIDGNLICIVDWPAVEVSTQGKFRGAEFQPLTFQLNTVTHERLKDAKGRLVPTVIARHLSETARDEIAKANLDDKQRLLAEIIKDGKASITEYAARCGFTFKGGSKAGQPAKSKAQKMIDRFHRDRLIEGEAGDWKVTPKGERRAQSKGVRKGVRPGLDGPLFEDRGTARYDESENGGEDQQNRPVPHRYGNRTEPDPNPNPAAYRTTLLPREGVRTRGGSEFRDLAGKPTAPGRGSGSEGEESHQESIGYSEDSQGNRQPIYENPQLDEKLRSEGRSISLMLVGAEPPGTTCVFCGRDEGQVYLYRDNNFAVRSEALHEKCARRYYEGKRNEETQDDPNSRT